MMKQYMMPANLREEMQKVDEVFNQTISAWSGEMKPYIIKLESDPLWQVIPAFVLGVCRYQGVDPDLSIAMANIFRNIYFASYIHEQIKDDEEGQEYNQKMRFSILIGDYIFGKILKLLLNANAAQLVDIFASLICKLSEGLTVKYKMDADFIDNLNNIYAPFFRAALLSASRLAGKGESEEFYGDLGHNLGLAICWHIMDNSEEGMVKVKYYLDESMRILKKIAPENKLTAGYVYKLMVESYPLLFITGEKMAAV
ncbi:hypothetical protein SAMN02745221_01231 [Thermosyntropha lipolytica DSM 11003]|uniref:Polyprenyl synthetase n=1 Tax=Thermosyntropha lipolytica DSM 11003 TaxID=1123382 RepID=A0A1M5NK26_9FIRM|nr:hypothetical protein [Thermosyntropha lipolytica]SHG89954.1 hypothetical protein SAMN02745221_01231 [Thermosyntropha lipolytica DSM 11003]